MSAALSALRAFGDEPRGESPYRLLEQARLARNLGGTAELFVPFFFWDGCAPFLLFNEKQNEKC